MEPPSPGGRGMSKRAELPPSEADLIIQIVGLTAENRFLSMRAARVERLEDEVDALRSRGDSLASENSSYRREVEELRGENAALKALIEQRTAALIPPATPSVMH